MAFRASSSNSGGFWAEGVPRDTARQLKHWTWVGTTSSHPARSGPAGMRRYRSRSRWWRGFIGHAKLCADAIGGETTRMNRMARASFAERHNIFEFHRPSLYSFLSNKPSLLLSTCLPLVKSLVLFSAEPSRLLPAM